MRNVRSTICLLAASMVLMAGLPVHAATVTASLQVSVVIRPWLQVSSEQRDYTYRVTKEDIARGYVDLPGLVSVNLRTNDPRELQVTVANDNGEAVLVKGAEAGAFERNSTVVIGSLQPGEMRRAKVDCRVLLAQDVREGEYPLNLSVYPSFR